MMASTEKLYVELRNTEKELINRLSNLKDKTWFTCILEEELSDVQNAMGKIEKGTFGECEFSGELLPEDLLSIVPILRTEKDCAVINFFYKKPYEVLFFDR